MKRILVLLLIAVFACVPFADAQQPSPGAAVTQTGSTGLAAQQCIQSTGTSSVALTVTIPPPVGANSVYIDYLVLAIGNTGTLTQDAAVKTFTSTNIAGTPSFPVTQVATTGIVSAAYGANGALAIPLKAQIGLGPTFVGPTANSAFFDAMTVCWHVAP